MVAPGAEWGGNVSAELTIGSRPVGSGQPCFVIAEAGVNHNGSLELAKKLVDAAVEAGADAVKFQTFKAERLAGRDAPKADYQLRTTDPGESQFDMLKKLELPDDAYPELFRYCADRRILFLSTPFDEEAADFLDALGVAAFKVPSGEVTNLPFLEHVAKKGKPVILSTGMCYLGEVEAAVRALEEAGASELAILHCTSNYPADPSSVNLRAMLTMGEAFGRPIGYSDHTEGIEVSLAAVALGAAIIEKHFTTDRNLPGPDQKASLEPLELKAMIAGIRVVEAALGSARKAPSAAELSTAAVARKSLFAAREIPAGTKLDRTMVIARRPGTGVSPALLSTMMGKRARRLVHDGDSLRPEDFE